MDSKRTMAQTHTHTLRLHCNASCFTTVTLCVRSIRSFVYVWPATTNFSFLTVRFLVNSVYSLSAPAKHSNTSTCYIPFSASSSTSSSIAFILQANALGSTLSVDAKHTQIQSSFCIWFHLKRHCVCLLAISFHLFLVVEMFHRISTRSGSSTAQSEII